MRQLTHRDRDEALDLCARDPASHVFVASRILDGGLGAGSTAAYGWFDDGRLESFVWTVANVVPVGTSAASCSAVSLSTASAPAGHCSTTTPPPPPPPAATGAPPPPAGAATGTAGATGATEPPPRGATATRGSP